MSSLFAQQLTTIRPKITLAETEESWDKIAAAIVALTKLIRDGMPDEIVDSLREFSRHLTSALRSERTRLCGPAMDLVTSVSSELGMSFEPLLSIYFPVLLNLCARANKVITNRARTSISSIVENTQLLSVIPYFLHDIKDKSAALRHVSIEGTITCLTGFDPSSFNHKEARTQEIETIITIACRDANADVRKAGKIAFNAYKIALPQRVESFVTPLSPKTRKMLDVPKTAATASSSSTTMLSRKPSTVKLSSSTSAAPVGQRTRTISTNRPVQPARPVSVPPTNPTEGTTTLTISQRDAIRSAMGAPTRPPQITKSQSTTSMAPPPMPVRPAIHLSRPTSANSRQAPQRPTHSRTTSTSSTHSTHTTTVVAPVRMQPAPVRAERVAVEEKPPAPRQPPPQRMQVAPVNDKGQGEGTSGSKAPTQPANRLRTRTVSMKNLRGGAPPPQETAIENDKSTATTHSTTSRAPAPKVDITVPKKVGPTATVTTGRAPAVTSRVVSKAASIIAFKPTSNPSRPRPGLTAPTASSQSKVQTKVIQPKKSVAILNIKGKEVASGSGAGPSKPNLVSKKSAVDLRKQKEETETKTRPRSRTVTATSQTGSSRPQSRARGLVESSSGKVEQTSRPPSSKGNSASRIPSRKGTPHPPENETEEVHDEASEGSKEEHVEESTKDIEGSTEDAEPIEEPVHADTPVAPLETTSNFEGEAQTEDEDTEVAVDEAPSTEAPADAENVPPPPPQLQVDNQPIDPKTPLADRVKKLDIADAKTPISALLLSIEEGFMFSPVRPLSPPEKYLHMDLNADGGFRFGIPASFNRPGSNEERPALGDLEMNQ